MSRSIISEGIATGDEPISQINVTSLVDVMVCLLIMFMVASPLMGPPEGMDVKLPAAHGMPLTEEEFLHSVISVDARGRVFLGSLPLADDAQTLKTELMNNVKIKEEGVVFLQGDEAVPFDRVLDVIVALKAAEVSRIGFITDPNALRREEEAKGLPGGGAPP